MYSPSNHGLSVDLGLGLLARYAPFMPGASRWDALSQRRFRLTLLRRLQTTEGVWQEHSPEYQILVTKVLDTFVRATDPEDRLLVTLLDAHAPGRCRLCHARRHLSAVRRHRAEARQGGSFARLRWTTASRP